MPLYNVDGDDAARFVDNAGKNNGAELGLADRNEAEADLDNDGEAGRLLTGDATGEACENDEALFLDFNENRLTTDILPLGVL